MTTEFCNPPHRNDVNLKAHHTAATLGLDVRSVIGSPSQDTSSQLHSTVFGQMIEQQSSGHPPTNGEKLYIDMSRPFCGIVCGLPGSGKSYSTAVLVESGLIADRRVGTQSDPPSVVAFHFNRTRRSAMKPCETAYLGILDKAQRGDIGPPPITVLVLPSMLKTMREVYGSLINSNIQVEPLHCAHEDVDPTRLLDLMKSGSEFRTIQDIFCGMEDKFDYESFRKELETRSENFSSTQLTMLDFRLHLLDTCLQGGSTRHRATFFFKPGHLTIIDLSSPFMDAASACALFDVVLSLFTGMDMARKLVVLDDAHKFLSINGCSTGFSDSLLSLVRQQRQMNTSVLISTQEPTAVPPKLLDLSSFVVAQRFLSPAWAKYLEEHVSIADSSWICKVGLLKTGEALVFTSGMTARGPGYVHVQVRPRITSDGGRPSASADDETPDQQTPELEMDLDPADITIRPSYYGNNSDDDVSFKLGNSPVPPGFFSPLTPITSTTSSFAATPQILLTQSPVQRSSLFISTPQVGLGLYDPRILHSPYSPTSPCFKSYPISLSSGTALPIQPQSQNPSLTVLSPSTPLVPSPTLKATGANPIDELRQTLLTLYRDGNKMPTLYDLAAFRTTGPQGSSRWQYSGPLTTLLRAAGAAGVVSTVGNKLQLNISPKYQLLVDVLIELHHVDADDSNGSVSLGRFSYPSVDATHWIPVEDVASLLRARSPGPYDSFSKLKSYLNGAAAERLVRTTGNVFCVRLATL